MSTSIVNVQVYKVGTTLHLWGGVIIKSWKSHYVQVPYHAYSTCIQTNNQANKDKKPIKKAQTIPNQENYTKKFKNCHKNKCKKGCLLYTSDAADE